MKERKYEVVLLDKAFTQVARYVRTFSSWQEARDRASALNRELDRSSLVHWIARLNGLWPELYRE